MKKTMIEKMIAGLNDIKPQTYDVLNVKKCKNKGCNSWEAKNTNLAVKNNCERFSDICECPILALMKAFPKLCKGA